MTKKVLEKDIEAYLCRRVRELGGICEKMYYANKGGSADRWVFMPYGRLYQVELKTAKGTVRACQVIEKERMTRLGFDYRVLRTMEEVDAFITCIKGSS